MEEDLKHKTKAGIYWKFLEQIFTNGMQFVVGIIMARMLTPEDYGITALPAIFLAIAATLIDSGFGLALVRKQDVTEKDLSTAFYYSIALGIVLYIIIFISAPWIASFYEVPILVPLMRITALTFLISPITTPQNVILQRRLDFKTPARISVTNKLVAAVLGIVAAYLGYGLWSLVIYSLSFTILGLIQTWIVVKWIPKEHFDKESFKYLWNFGNKLMASGLLSTLFNNIAPAIIGKYFGTFELGLFNRANGYARLPYQQVTASVQTVTFPVLSKLQNDDDALIRNYNRIVKTVCFFYFPIMLLLVALARPLVLVLLTEKWEQCIPLLQILSFVTITGPLSVLNMNVLQVKGFTNLYLKADVYKKSIEIVIMIITIPIGLTYYCIGLVVSQICALYINFSCVSKVISLGIVKQIKELTSSLILSIVMMCVVMCVNSFITNLYLQLILGSLIGIIFYFGLAYIFKYPEFEDLKFLLKFKK